MEPADTSVERHGASAAGEEIELKLVALDPDVLDALADQTELDGYQLSRQPPRAIRDRYWDTPDRRLSNHGFSLRVRIENGAPKLTLKGAGTREDGLVRHPELEVAADANGWRTVCDELTRAALQLPGRPLIGSDPMHWLQAAGLELTQDRRTARRVLLAAREGRMVAELALDETTYSLGIYEVRFREVEIESLTGETCHILALGAALRSRFGDRLTSSDRNKYARGLDLAGRLA